MYRILIIFIFSLSPFYAAGESTLLTFHELQNEFPKKLNLQQQVQIRGFLYKASDGRLILAAEPNLKSCCVASHANLSRQITISSNEQLPLSDSQAIFLEGKLIVEANHFHMENVTLIHEEKSGNRSFWVYMLMILAAIGTILIIYSRRKK